MICDCENERFAGFYLEVQAKQKSKIAISRSSHSFHYVSLMSVGVGDLRSGAAA